MRSPRSLIALVLALALVTAACGDDDTSSDGGDAGITNETISTTEYLAFRDQTTACGDDAPLPARAMSFAAPENVGVAQTATAVLSTSCGDITIELDPTIAPAAVNSFVYLAEEGYFDGSVSHRVVDGFMVQMGDPTATGRGGPGYLLPDELPPDGFLYSRGVVAMANAGPNTGGSQFFMMLADSPLPPAYSVFGTVVEGIEVLDLMAQVPTVARRSGAEPSSPTETIYIESIEISR